MVTGAVPAPIIFIFLAAVLDKSIILVATNGPLSLILTTVLKPFLLLVTFTIVFIGSVL